MIDLPAEKHDSTAFHGYVNEFNPGKRKLNQWEKDKDRAQRGKRWQMKARFPNSQDEPRGSKR